MSLQCNRCWCDIDELLCPECATNTGGSANTSTNTQSTAIAQIADEIERLAGSTGMGTSQGWSKMKGLCQQLRTF